VNENGSDPHQLNVEACLYLYPLVSMEVTCGQMTVIEAGQIPGRAPVRQFAHVTEVLTADRKAAVRLRRELGS
jgi:hypothetical protein